VSNPSQSSRRGFIGQLVAGAAIAQLAIPQAARAASNASFGTLKSVRAGVLEIGYAEAGPADGTPVILLHGWPYDIHSYVEVAPLLATAGYRVLVPYLRGYGTTRFLSPDTPRNAQQSAVASDVIALMDALKIERAIVAGCDWGARTACVVAALWPERVRALVSVSGYIVVNWTTRSQPQPPSAELPWWYQYYFATERGRLGYERYRKEFARLIWQQASPQWKFDDTSFERSARALDNPDHVAIVMHNYRWRIGQVEGEAKYDALENRLASAPQIRVPAITLEGEANGAPHAPPASYAARFAGPYLHRTLGNGVGHNLPQEAPDAFAQAVIDVDAMAR